MPSVCGGATQHQPWVNPGSTQGYTLDSVGSTLCQPWPWPWIKPKFMLELPQRHSKHQPRTNPRCFAFSMGSFCTRPVGPMNHLDRYLPVFRCPGSSPRFLCSYIRNRTAVWSFVLEECTCLCSCVRLKSFRRHASKFPRCQICTV